MRFIGADGCLIQTVDRVYSTKDEADYARVAAMAAIVKAVADATRPDFQVGVQIMVNALKASLAVAKERPRIRPSSAVHEFAYVIRFRFLCVGEIETGTAEESLEVTDFCSGFRFAFEM